MFLILAILGLVISCFNLQFSSDRWGDFSVGASGKEPVCQSRRCKRRGFDPWVRKIPWRRAWQPIPVCLPGESHGQRSLLGLWSMGLQRVRHDWSDLACTCSDIWTYFHMLSCHLSIFFCQVSVEIFCSFLMGLLILLLLTFKSSLHILGNTPFFIICTCLLQIFSSSLWLVFSFFWQYLSESNILNLNSSFLFLSWIVPLVVYLKNDYSRSPRFSSMLSSWSFTVYILCLCLWSVLFYFVKGISSVTRSIFFSVWCPCVLSRFVENLSFLYCISSAPLSKLSRLYLWGSVSRLSILYHWSICLFFSLQYHTALVTAAL